MHEQRSRTGLWLWLAGGVGVTGLVVVAISAFAVAVLGASFTGCQPSAAPPAVSGPTPSAYAVQSIPPERLRLYEQAGARFDLDWSFLASIGAQECGNGECAGTNSSGCAGPMQIAYVRGSACSPGAGPTLWERYAVNAEPGHPLSINDPADAIDTAARILREDMDAPPTGGTYAEYRQAACHYYGACADSTVSYADEVMARAVQYGFTGSGAPAATSPPLAQPVSTEGCEASVFTPEAASSQAIVKVAESQVGQGENPPGSDCTIYGPCEEWCSLFGSTPGCRCPARPPPTDTPGRSMCGRANTAAECYRRARRQRQATRSSTAPGRAKARTSGSSPKCSRTVRSSPSRGTTPGTSPASGRSSPAIQSARPRPSTGTRSHPRPAKRRAGSRERRAPIAGVRGVVRAAVRGALRAQVHPRSWGDARFPACWCGIARPRFF
jgi:hypothetical protein